MLCSHTRSQFIKNSLHPHIMKTILSLILLSFCVSGIAVAGPVNTTCPMSGKAVKEGVTSQFNGKTVGFCCTNCKAKFDSNPEKFGKKFK